MYLFWILLYFGLSIYILLRLFPKIINYIAKPILNSTANSISISSVSDEEEQAENAETEPTKVEIVSGKYDTSKIIEYKGEEISKFEFRPRNFLEFVSQEQAKEQAKTIIKKVNRGIKGHLFLSARQGMGKTTFIKLLATELKAKLIIRVGKQLDHPEELVNIVNEITTCPEKNVIFFIDEMDSMDKTIIKMLNPIIEEFEISGKKIKPFIFAGASISKDTLIKNNPDTLDRISHAIHFTAYSAEDIKTILNQYKTQLYPNDNVSNEILNIISNSCKFCPRISISLLEDFIVEQDIQKVLKNRRIVKNGLTEVDIKILQVLNKAIRPMGANAVALRAGLTQRQYTEEFEGFLYEFGYINRTPSRIISPKGKQLLEELSERIIQ